MLNAIDSVDDVPEILPLYYRNLIKNNREFFEKIILFHDIGKNNVHYVMEDGSVSFVGHEDESVRMLDEHQDLLKGYPQRDLVKKISGLHGTPFNLTGVKDEIRKDFDGFLKKNDINLHEFELLVCTIFLDMYWPHPANKNYDQEMGRIKDGISFIEGIREKKGILNIEYLDSGLKGEKDRATATMVNLKEKQLVFKGWDKRSADPFTAEERQIFKDGGPQIETSFVLVSDQIKSYRHKFHERQSGEATVEAVITDNEDKKHYYYLTGADTTALDHIKNVRPTLEKLRHPDAEFEVSAANQGDLVGNFTILPNVSRDGWKLYAAVNEPWNNKSHRSLIQTKDGEIKIGFVRLHGESDKNRIHQIYFRQGLKNDDSIGEYLLSPEEIDFVFIAYVIGWEGTEVRELLKENYINTSDLRHVFRLPFIDIEGVKGNLFYKQIAQNSEIFGDVFAGKAVDLELTYDGRNLLDPEFGFLKLMESNGYLQKFDPQGVNDPGDYYIEGNRISIIFLPARYPVNALAVSEDGLNMAFVIVEGFSGRLGANYWTFYDWAKEQIQLQFNWTPKAIFVLDNGVDPQILQRETRNERVVFEPIAKGPMKGDARKHYNAAFSVVKRDRAMMNDSDQENISILALTLLLERNGATDPQVDEYFVKIFSHIHKINPDVDPVALFNFYNRVVDGHIEEFKYASGKVSVSRTEEDVHSRYRGEHYERTKTDNFFMDDFLKKDMRIPDVYFLEIASEELGRVGGINPDHYYTQGYENFLVAPTKFGVFLRFCVLAGKLSMEENILRNLPIRKIILGEKDDYRSMVDLGVRFLGRDRGPGEIGNKENGFLLFDRLSMPYPPGIVLSEQLVKFLFQMSEEERKNAMLYIIEKLKRVGVDMNEEWMVRSNPKQSMPGILETHQGEGNSFWQAIQKVADSWYSQKAVRYRKRMGISNAYDLPIIIQIFKSGKSPSRDDMKKRKKDPGISLYAAGVFSTRNPNTNEDVLFGRYAVNSYGASLMSNFNEGEDINLLADSAPDVYRQLLDVKKKLEDEDGPQEVEFVVSDGKLYFVQTRALHFAPQAEIAYIRELLAGGKITEARVVPLLEALQKRLKERKIYNIKDTSGLKVIGGASASTPGAFQGYLAFTEEEARKLMAEHKPIIFVIQSRTDADRLLPLAFDYLHSGLITSCGNSSSHEAVLSRLAGVASLINVPVYNKRQTYSHQLILKNGLTLRQGDQVVIDGDTGILYEDPGVNVLEENGVVLDASYGIDILAMRKTFLAPYMNNDGTIKSEFTLQRLEELNKAAVEKFTMLEAGKDKKAAFIANLEKHFLHDLLIQFQKLNPDSGAGQDKDDAMLSKAPGGIDMNDIQVQHQGFNMNMRFDSVALQSLKEEEISGFVPVIMDFTPVKSLLAVLEQ